MATRFYIPNDGPPSISPAFDASWDDTADAVRRLMFTEKTGTVASNRVAGGDGSGAANVLIVQYVSAPLAAQTISGMIKGQIKARELSTAINARAQLVAKVVSGNGLTERGTLAAAQSEALSSEWATSATNRSFPLAALSPVTVSPVNAQEGDVLVIEIGALVDDNGVNTILLALQDDQVSDLPEDETSTAAANPWIEFSATLAFQSDSPATIPCDVLGLGLNPLAG